MTKKIYSLLALLCLTVSSAWAQGPWTSGDCTVTLSGGEMTVSGSGAMHNYSGAGQVPWNSNKSVITSVVIGDGVTSIGSFAFSGCSNLSTISFGSGLTTIFSYAFQNCTNLTEVTLPASVTTIQQSFGGCTNLTTVTLNSNPAILGTAFPSGATVTMNLTAHEGETGEYWMTFYNKYQNFQVPATGTQIFKAALSGTKLELTELTTDQTVTKDKPVILKSTASPIVMTLTSTASSNDFSGNDLSGVSAAAGMTAADPSTTYVLNTGSQGVGFYKLASGKTIGLGKAYLTYSGGGVAAARGYFLFDETTGIEMPTVEGNGDAEAVVYDLQGRRVLNPTKGLYIVNGKKVFINK